MHPCIWMGWGSHWRISVLSYTRAWATIAHPEKSCICTFHLGKGSISGVGVAQPQMQRGSHQNNPAMHLGGLRSESLFQWCKKIWGQEVGSLEHASTGNGWRPMVHRENTVFKLKHESAYLTKYHQKLSN